MVNIHTLGLVLALVPIPLVPKHTPLPTPKLRPFLSLPTLKLKPPVARSPSRHQSSQHHHHPAAVLLAEEEVVAEVLQEVVALPSAITPCQPARSTVPSPGLQIKQSMPQVLR